MDTNRQSVIAAGGSPGASANEPIRPVRGDAPWTETLRDGTSVLIRPIREEDEQLERRFIEELSPQSRRYRFLGSIKSPDARLLTQLTHVDNVNQVAFVALIAEGVGDREIGVSRYSAQGDSGTCECAVAVSDEWHNLGLATLLMQPLIEAARRHGFSSMYSIDAADNRPMRDLVMHLGFKRSQDPDDATQVLHTLDLNAPTV